MRPYSWSTSFLVSFRTLLYYHDILWVSTHFVSFWQLFLLINLKVLFLRHFSVIIYTWR
nr:MAG TPA: hypothetical protein [Caudoviricetes sp.]DAY27999.1 MAG TPA: hypothetical protein [Caudoviricetes sp.]